YDDNWSEYAFLASVPATATTYIDTGVTDGDAYTYRIYASNSKGVTAYSTEKTAYTPLDPLTNLVAYADQGNVVLKFENNHEMSTGTIIERRSGTVGPFAKLDSIGRNNTYTDASVVNGTLYTYRVRESNERGWSLPSNEVMIRFVVNRGTVLPTWSHSTVENNVVSD